MNKKLGALGIAVAVFAMACSDPMTPTRTLVSGGVAATITPHPINFQGGGTLPAGFNFRTVYVCKNADAPGSFTFTMTLNGGSSVAIPGGAINVTVAGTPVCREVHVSSVNNAATPEVVTVTEDADQANWSLTGIDIDQYFGANVVYPAPRLSGDVTGTPARGATVYINDDLTKVITFTNHFTPPTISCTYTKGWYRNKNGSPTVIAVDGRSIADAQAIFKATPGKPNGVTWGSDNNNLNLYQQLLAALQNLDGDPLGGPNAVDQAIADALAATGGSGLVITVAPGTDVSGLINTLSSFNEGAFTGFPHCSDEILDVI